MVGQGSPSPRRISILLYALRIAVCGCWCALSSVGIADEISLRVRISWGGGSAKIWQGKIDCVSGECRKLATLGLEADAAAAVIAVNDHELKLMPRSPHVYNGVDVQVSGESDAKLRVELGDVATANPIVFESTLAELISGQKSLKLDEQGNRLGVYRLPSDCLRYSSDSKELVFETNEKWTCNLQPYLVSEAANQSVILSMEVKSLANNEIVWQQDAPIALDSQGTSELAAKVQAPLKSAGVYELTAELRSRPLVTALVRPKVWATRKIQCVVVSPELPNTQLSEWKQVDEFDPALVKNGDRGLRIAGWKLLSSSQANALGSGPLGSQEWQGRKWNALEPQGWQAYPLTIATPHQPHIVEVEYPGDWQQTMGVSLLEPNAAGKVLPLGLDSGIEVAAPAPGAAATVEKHRVVFWPRSKSPLLLFTNLNSQGSAILGKVRVLAGPTHLPAASTGVKSSRSERRWLLGYFEKPFFPENFSSYDNYDVKTARTFEDWQTYYSGSQRLAEYLRFAGLNAAVIPAHHEGCTLYPSEIFDATPKYDGVLFSEERMDPTRKDVLEVLCREFNRHDLTLIPTLQFSTPLPELEELKARGSPAETEGIDLVNHEGRTWAQSIGTRGGEAPYYNLLDSRVQAAMRKGVLELARRYRDHESFGGVAMTLSTETYAQLPDETWGLDAVTFAHFLRDRGIVPPKLPNNDCAARWQWIQQHAAPTWQQWRVTQVSKFYQDLCDELVAMRADLRLLLTPVQPLGSSRLEARLHPRMPPNEQFQTCLLSTGLDPVELCRSPNLVWTRVQHAAPATQPPGDPTLHLTNDSQQLDELARSVSSPTGISLRSPIPLRLEAFEKVSPWGATNTNAFLLLHPTPTVQAARKPWIEMLAKADMSTLGVGGSMLSLGQEDAVRPLLQTLAQLPVQRFTALAAPANTNTQSVEIRAWSGNGKSWFYLLNDSAWSAIVDVDFRAMEPLLVNTLGSPTAEQLKPTNGLAHWRVRLQPYDLIALSIPQENVNIAQWSTQVEQVVELSLRERLRELRLRANTLRSPEPLTMLFNAGFEGAVMPEGVQGWQHAKAPGITVELDRRESHSGQAALHVVSRPIAGQPAPTVWLRSQPIPTPATQRLALWVWLRTSDVAKQPKLRLAVEGKFEGKTYYRRANVGSSEDQNPVQPLQATWTPFLFPLDDLPASGLTDLRVGFDLMGEGEVWIDDIQLYDLWFQDNERDALLKEIAVAEVQLQARHYRDCANYLDGYWSRYLFAHAPLPTQRVASRNMERSDTGATLTTIPETATKKTPSMFERMRQWSPRLPFQKNKGEAN